MKTMPKLLPWLAGKAGISKEKAFALWGEIESDEFLRNFNAKDPDHYYRAVIDRLHAMAGGEQPASQRGTHLHKSVLVLSRHGDASSAILLNPFSFKMA